jgi:glycosyltransferase involved in cell wall biosynthesis
MEEPTMERRLRIAMVAPPYFPVPPDGYGGIESVVGDLVDALVARGHHVTLVGAGDHGTAAQEFVATQGSPMTESLGEPLSEVLHVARVAEELDAGEFDLVHDHTLGGGLLAHARDVPTVVTVHGPVTGRWGQYYRALREQVRFIGISAAQRAAAPDLPWLSTVHNAICVDSYPFVAEKEDLAVFLGRFQADKGPHLAIDAARSAGLPIVLAGKCQEPCEIEYFEREITPRLGPDVTIHGMADAVEKRELLGRASCLLFPICWDEPFGMVMIEAMACGTPVVALRRGSVPEVVANGVSGVVIDRPEQLVGAIATARGLRASDCREHASRNFSTSTMAAGYEAAYYHLLDRS